MLFCIVASGTVTNFFPTVVATLGYGNIVSLLPTGPRYFAMMLMVPSVYTGYVVALAWISNTLPRPPAKRAAALALINAVSNTSSIYASYSKAPPFSSLILGLSHFQARISRDSS